MRSYIFLLISIVFEMIGSAFLKMSEGFTKFLSSLLLVLFYIISFTFIIFALKNVSLSVGYSIWAGLGTASAALVGLFLFNEKLSSLNMIGLVVIISGIIIMNSTNQSESTREINIT